MAKNRANQPSLKAQSDTLRPSKQNPSLSKNTDNSMSSLTIKNKAGNTYSLSDKQLEQWLASVAKANIPSSESALAQADDEGITEQLLSPFGIKNATQVGAFLRSPAGHSVLDMIQDELAELAAEEEHAEFLAQEEAKRKHRNLAFLLLGLMYDEEAAADALNEAVNAQNEKRLKEHEDALRVAAKEAELQEQSYHNPQLDFINNSLDQIEDKLAEKNRQLAKVDNTIAALNEERKELDLEHNMLDSHVSELNDFLAKTDQKPNQTALIDERLESLDTTIKQKDQEINQAIESGKESEARRQLNERMGLQIQIDGLRNKKEVTQGEKHFWNSDGEKVSSPKDAQIVLDAKKQVVKDGDKCYIIPANESLDSIKSSSNAQERLAAAQNDHQSALKNQCSVHNRVDQQKKQNDSHHTQHLTQTHAQKSTLQSDIALLSDQKLKLQDSQTQLKRKLQQQNITVNQVNQAPGLTNPSAGQANQVPGQIAPTSGQINQTQQPSTRANLSAPADSRMPRTIPAQNNQIQQATSSGNRPLNADALKRVLQNPQTRAQFTQNFTKNHGGDPRFNAFIAALKQMPANKPAPENKINSALKQLQTSESLTAQKEKQQDKQKTPTPTSTTPKMR